MGHKQVSGVLQRSQARLSILFRPLPASPPHREATVPTGPLCPTDLSLPGFPRVGECPVWSTALGTPLLQAGQVPEKTSSTQSLFPHIPASPCLPFPLPRCHLTRVLLLCARENWGSWVPRPGNFRNSKSKRMEDQSDPRPFTHTQFRESVYALHI